MSIVDLKNKIEIVLNHDEMTINNPVMQSFKVELDAALMMAAMVADGKNVVTVSAKLVIEEVTVDEFSNSKTIHHPKWSVKVTTKNDIYDGGDKLNSYIVEKDEDGLMTARDMNEDKQLRIDQLGEEDSE